MVKFHESSIRSKWRCARAVASFHDAPNMLSRSEMVEELCDDFEFLYMGTNPEEDVREWPPHVYEMFGGILAPELFNTALFFNYDPEFNYFIDECEDEADSDGGRLVRNIYKFIRESGWSLIENPLEHECWALYPTHRLYTDHVLCEEETPFSF